MASEPLLDAIKTAFSDLNIDLQHEELSDCSMLHSKTNKFMQVKAKDGEIYLIRINGKLWPPFERPSEANNLEMLRQKKIKTNVIHNGSEFQICYFKPEEKRFSMIIDEDMKMECLEKVAESIKNYQAAVEFQNVLSIRKDLVEKAFNQMLLDKKTKLNFYYEIIKKIIFVVEHDRKDHVSSHNDLLPSDIYYIDGEVIIVDWEYSALNHPFYDLAHLSVLSSLTMEQDQAFLTTYNKSIKNFSIGQGHSFILMKAIISFLLLAWNRDLTKDEQLTIKFQANLQDVFGYAFHENSMVSELASFILSETVIFDLLKPFAFRSSPMRSSMNSCLLESIQIIMNNGRYDAKEVSALLDKLRSAIKMKDPENDYVMEKIYPKEYYETIVLPILSEICSIKFYVYKKVNGLVESEPLRFGDNPPYLQLCAYLIFHEDSQHYEPVCLLNTKDDTIVKTKFLINSPTYHLLESFVHSANALDFQVSKQASEGSETENDFTADATAIVVDQRKGQLLSYVNQLREFRHNHLPESNVQINDEVLDQNKAEEEIHTVLQKELDFIFSIANQAKAEEITLVEEQPNAVSLIEQQGGEERYVGTPIRVSEASVATSDSRPNTDAIAPPVIPKIPNRFDWSSTLTKETQWKKNSKQIDLKIYPHSA